MSDVRRRSRRAPRSGHHVTGPDINLDCPVTVLVQVWKVRLRNAFLASGYIPVHALDQYLNHLFTGIRNSRQVIETGAWLGCLDGCIDELNLVHGSIYRYIHRSTQYILVHTSVCMHRSTSGAMRSLTMKGNVSISIFI